MKFSVRVFVIFFINISLAWATWIQQDTYHCDESNNEEYDCIFDCPLKCDTLYERCVTTSCLFCQPGCYCKKGYARRNDGCCIPACECFP
ncbi:venom peptide BmKAPI-like [Diabrotica virgifera virgifera]|uniref:Uncharacterized protein n=1 Tax=Diabrotica virgifera virgifera TaxID=50390 RepID=A0ABM5IDB8_DIAVI|nr:venom peptide BmKAPI-like [Diabrotica virgifera virgifera]